MARWGTPANELPGREWREDGEGASGAPAPEGAPLRNRRVRKQNARRQGTHEGRIPSGREGQHRFFLHSLGENLAAAL